MSNQMLPTKVVVVFCPCGAEDELVLPATTEDQIPTIQVSLRRAQPELQAVVKEATHARQEFLLHKQTSATISSNPTEALKWRNIMKAEEIKRMYRKLRFVCKDCTRQPGLSSLLIPTNPLDDPKKCNDWTTVDTPAEITQYLLQ
jgi:hypothetical protein